MGTPKRSMAEIISTNLLMRQAFENKHSASSKNEILLPPILSLSEGRHESTTYKEEYHEKGSLASPSPSLAIVSKNTLYQGNHHITYKTLEHVRIKSRICSDINIENAVR